MLNIREELAQEFLVIKKTIQGGLPLHAQWTPSPDQEQTACPYARLVMLGSKLGSERNRDVYPLALAIEMLGKAIVAHRSIFAPKAHQALENMSSREGHVSLLSGDYCFAYSFDLLSKLQPDWFQYITKALEGILEGEWQWRENRCNLYLPVVEYVKLLCHGRHSYPGLALAAGGLFAGLKDETQIEGLRLFGVYATVASVLKREVDITRKEPKRLLEAGKWRVSIPLLLYLSRRQTASGLREGDDGCLGNPLSGQHPELLVKGMQREGVFDQSMAIAREYQRKALQSLEPLDPHPVKDTLKQLVLL